MTEDKKDHVTSDQSKKKITVEQSHSHVTTYRSLREIQNRINEHIGMGHKAEIKGNIRDAEKNYTESLRLIDSALDVLNSSTSQLSLNEEIQQSLLSAKQTVSMRLESLQPEASYSSHPGHLSHHQPHFKKDSVYDINILVQKVKSEPADATEIFTIPNAVSIFYISKDGTVMTSYEQFSLHIVKFNLGYTDSFVPSAFLQVGDWLYPLMPGLSPSLITKYGAYLFPDVLSKVEDMTVALVFSLAVSEFERKKFESILNNYTLKDTVHAHMTTSSSDIVSEVHFIPTARTDNMFGPAHLVSFAISLVASMTSWIIAIVALLLVWLLQMGSEFIRAQIEPAAEPQRVDPMVRTGIIYVKTATAATVKVQQYIVDKLGEGALTLATNITPFLMEQGETILKRSFNESNSELMKGTAEITSTSLQGITKVYNSLDRAADSLIKNLTDESVHIIEHRYGEEIGTLASDTLSTAKGVVLMATSAQGMDLMSFATIAGMPKGLAALRSHVRRSSKAKSFNIMNTPKRFMTASTKVRENTQNFANIFEQIGPTKPHMPSRPSVIFEEDITRYSKDSDDCVIRRKSTKMDKFPPFSRKYSVKGTERKYSKLPTDEQHSSTLSKGSPPTRDTTRFSHLPRKIIFDKNLAVAFSNRRFSQLNINKLMAEQRAKEYDNNKAQSEVDAAHISGRKLFRKHSDINYTLQVSRTSVNSPTHSRSSISGRERQRQSYEKAKMSVGDKIKDGILGINSEIKEKLSHRYLDNSFDKSINKSQESVKNNFRENSTFDSIKEKNSEKSSFENIDEKNQEKSSFDNIKENNQEKSSVKNIKENNQEKLTVKNIKENNQGNSSLEHIKKNSQEMSSLENIKENNQEKSSFKSLNEDNQNRSGHESISEDNQDRLG